MKKILKKLNAKRDEQRALGNKGFTLIELLVVIAILGILVLLAAPSFLGYTKDAAVATMQADAKVLANSALVYNIDNEEWPADGVVDDVVIPGAGAGNVYNAIDADAIADHVQTLKGELTDYVITVDGADEGTVFHKDGVEDKEGTVHHGVKN